MNDGIVRWFDAKKGYGFLTSPEAPGEDILVHYSVIQEPGFRKLAEGERVRFEHVRTAKGLRATTVHKRKQHGRH